MKYINENKAIELFDAYLNKGEPIFICGFRYLPSKALKAVDETAYREEFYNWLDEEGLTIDIEESEEYQKMLEVKKAVNHYIDLFTTDSKGVVKTPLDIKVYYDNLDNLKCALADLLYKK